MTAFFLTCAALGGGILVLQLVLSLVGIGHDVDHDVSHDLAAGEVAEHGGHVTEPGLNLLSLRALAAGVAFFGVGGLAVVANGTSTWIAMLVAVLLGVSAVVAVAAATRAMLRFEDDGVVHIEGAVGVSGSVYLTIPGGHRGLGKVQVPVQGRLVEYQAVTAHTDTLPTGARIVVVDVVGPDTVVVAPDPLSLSSEVPHVVR